MLVPSPTRLPNEIPPLGTVAPDRSAAARASRSSRKANSNVTGSSASGVSASGSGSGAATRSTVIQRTQRVSANTSAGEAARGLDVIEVEVVAHVLARGIDHRLEVPGH